MHTSGRIMRGFHANSRGFPKTMHACGKFMRGFGGNKHCFARTTHSRTEIIQ
jgi:hypothetical protein